MDQVSTPTVVAELGLDAARPAAGPKDPPAVHLRVRLHEQLRALLEHEQVARAGVDPEGVHQMRVAVRRMRAALKAEGSTLGDVDLLQAELKWLGGALGALRDLDVLLDHLRDQTAGLSEFERAAAEQLLAGLVADRRRARQRMLGALRTRRYRQLLESLAMAALSDPPQAASANGRVGRAATRAELLDVIKRPYRKLRKAVRALDHDPADDDLHALRIRGKRLRYAVELAEPVIGKPARKLIKATKEFQDVLGDHQDAVVAEEQVRRLVEEENDADVAFVAGRLVEREQAKRADCRARWRAAYEEVDQLARTVLQ